MMMGLVVPVCDVVGWVGAVGRFVRTTLRCPRLKGPLFEQLVVQWWYGLFPAVCQTMHTPGLLPMPEGPSFPSFLG
jgi:hypothetical protein